MDDPDLLLPNRQARRAALPEDPREPPRPLNRHRGTSWRDAP